VALLLSLPSITSREEQIMTTFFAIVGGIVTGIILWVMLILLTSLLFPHEKDPIDKATFVVGTLTYLIGGGVAAWLMV
jgi:hypothetical protein